MLASAGKWHPCTILHMQRNASVGVWLCFAPFTLIKGFNIRDRFRLCPQYAMFAPPIAEHESLHDRSLCKNITLASGGANNMHPLSWGGGAQTEKIQYKITSKLEVHYAPQIRGQNKCIKYLSIC